MSGKFTHYLVTRFNIHISGKGPERIESIKRPIGWDNKRISLFAKYCAPSVMGQSCQNFKWLIYFQLQTDVNLLQKVHEILKDYANVEILFVDGYEGMLDHLKKICASTDTPFILTSRLDNDDAIGKLYIQTIQSNFIPSRNCILNLLGGTNYHESKQILTYLRHKETNSFTTLIEQKNIPTEICTIMGFSHMKPKAGMITRNVPCKYAFWITLHGQNAVTRHNRGWPIFSNHLAKNYSLDPTQIHISYFKTTLYALSWLPAAAIKKIKFLSRNFFKRRAINL